MVNLRRYIVLSLALVFMLSGMANAYARAMMAGAHSIEICAELGNDNITLGINGEKLPTLPDCARCCIAVAVLQDAAPFAVREGRANITAWRGYEPVLNPGNASFSLWPRGPPVKA